MKNSNSVQGKDQRKMITEQDKEGLGDKGRTTTIIIGITDRTRPQKKRGIGSMLSLVGNTKDNTFGVSVVQTSMVTTETTITTLGEIKATKEVTTETSIRAIQMEITTTRSSRRELTPVTWMSTGT